MESEKIYSTSDIGPSSVKPILIASEFIIYSYILLGLQITYFIAVYSERGEICDFFYPSVVCPTHVYMKASRELQDQADLPRWK
jgi:hypothetical protein